MTDNRARMTREQLDCFLAANGLRAEPDGTLLAPKGEKVGTVTAVDMDTFLALVRRARSGRGVLRGDRRHLYDLIRAKGISEQTTVLAVYGLSIGGGATALVVPRISAISAIALGAAEFAIMFLAAKRLGAFEPS